MTSVDDMGYIYVGFFKLNIRCVLHGLEPTGTFWWTKKAVEYMLDQLIRPNLPSFRVKVVVFVEGDSLHVKLTY